MKILLFIAAIAYFLGFIIRLLELREKFKDLDYSSEFSIVIVARLVVLIISHIEALIWPYSLIISPKNYLEKENDTMAS